MSTAVTSSISVDLQKPNICEVVYAKQYDRLKREIAVSVYDNGTAYSLSSTDKYIVRGVKPDRTIFYYDKTDDGSTAVSVSDNVATVKLAQQTLSCPGDVKVEVCVTNETGSEILTTFAFILKIEASAVNGPASTNYINPAIASVKNVYINDESHLIVELTTGGALDAGITGESTIKEISVTYQASSSGTTPPTGEWLSSPPEVAEGQYLWTKSYVLYSTGASYTAYSVGYHGEKGDVGPQGEKGDTGDAAGFGTVTATVDANVGTPSVEVTVSGPNTAKNFDFKFKNMKGETGATPTIDAITDAQIDALFA